MKKNTLLLVAGTATGLIIGFLVGLFVDFPKPDQSELSGTIRKVDNYRNAKASEADIQLQNALVSDSVALKMMQNYVTFHYVDAVKMCGDIDQAIAAAKSVEAFKTSAKAEIEALSGYGLYLSSARLYFITAMAVCKDPGNADPALIRNSLNQVTNIIAQKNYRNRSVLNFISQVETFVNAGESGDYPGLMQAHDLLALNLANSSAITGDKIMQKFLGKKALMTDYKKLAWYQPAQTLQKIQQDMEKLSAADAEKLGTLDAEKMGFLDSEKMSFVVQDAEKMGVAVFDAERLGTILDAEKVGIIADFEKMGFVGDAEKMSGAFMDTEKMGGAFMDAENMGFLFDAQKMGDFMDAQNLGSVRDMEIMGII